MTLIDDHFKYEDRYDSREYGTTTLYFTGPASLLSGKYPEAESATISVEFPKEHMEPGFATVMISPCKYFEEADGYEDYDWTDLDLPYEDIDRLFSLAQRAQKEHLSDILQNAAQRLNENSGKESNLSSREQSR